MRFLVPVALAALISQVVLATSCPGYNASNVQTSDNGLKADLVLAGAACEVYGEDLTELTLQVTCETSKYMNVDAMRKNKLTPDVDDRIHVVIQDQAKQVYQVPESVFPRPTESSSCNDSKLQFDYVKEPFSFTLSRSGSGEVLFDTSAETLIFESQYVRLRTSLPTDPYLYGLGEHSDSFRLNTTNFTRTLWARDSYLIPEGTNLYGSHPVYFEQRSGGAHGVFLLNSNGMDIFINQTEAGDQYLEYNTLGGVLDFYFFAGPSPVETAQQYSQVVGQPTMQPYWGLGFHQCRYGYQDVFNVAEVVYNYSQANIPLETMWTDIDYMDLRRVFTLDPDRFPLHKMRELVDHLHENQQHYIVMVDPAVAYQDYGPLNRGLEDDIFLLRDNGSVYKGVVWPGVTVFPDWFSENITDYWNGEFARFFDADTGVDIDALWIDMNEPSNFCYFPCEHPEQFAIDGDFPPAPPAVRSNPRPLPGWPADFQPGNDESEAESKRNMVLSDAKVLLSRSGTNRHFSREADTEMGLPGRDLLYPEYAIHNAAAGEQSWNADKGGLSNSTARTDLIHQNGLAMYDTKNLFGHMMSIASRDAMIARRPGLRPMIITRSTFAGAGSKVGHWLGDNGSTWWHYLASIRTLLGFTSIYSFSMVGSDVCGFAQNTTEQLCARWASLGAFSPFYRNHNEINGIPQEFYRWESVADSARKAIEIRYRLLDYLYTQMYTASLDGTPVLLPTFYLYPNDTQTWPLQYQYFYGPGLLVAPVIDENSTSVDVYLPDGTFYDWYTHEQILGTGANHTFDNQDITTIPLLIRGGVILPLRIESANTTAQLRTKGFEILIPVGSDGTASGSLYLDDGVSLEQDSYTMIVFEYDDGKLSVNGTFSKDYPIVVEKVTVLDSQERSVNCSLSLTAARTWTV